MSREEPEGRPGQLWRELSDRERGRASVALDLDRPVDDALVPAVVSLLRSRKRDAIRLAWLGTAVFGVGGALVVALMGHGDGALWLRALRAMALTVPLSVVLFGATAFWMYGDADQLERRLRAQLGEPAAGRSVVTRAAWNVGRAVLAVLLGIVGAPLVTFPIGLIALLIGRLGVPIHAVPDGVGIALGAVVVLVLTAYSYRWLRSDPSSPLRTGTADR